MYSISVYLVFCEVDPSCGDLTGDVDDVLLLACPFVLEGRLPFEDVLPLRCGGTGGAED